MSAPHAPPPIVKWWWVALLLLLHVLPFATRPALVGGDEVHYALMASSLALDHDTALGDDYAEVAAGSAAAGRKRAGQVLDRHLRRVGEVDLFTHPIGLPMLAAPFVALQQWIAPGSPPDLLLVGLTLGLTWSALWLARAALITRLGDHRRACWLVVGGYLCSPLWFYGRTFFTEPITWALAVLALVALHAGRPAVASVLLGLVLFTKETTLLLIAPILVGVWVAQGRRRAIGLAIGPAVAAGVYLGRNLASGLPLSTGSQEFQLGDLGQGLLGLLFDSQHELAAFAPALALALAYGVASALGTWRVRSRELLVPRLALTAFLGYLLLHAAWIDWRGGSCYGPRLLVPALPALILLAASTPALARRTAIGVAVLFVAGFTVAWTAALQPWEAFWGASAWSLVCASPLATAAGVLLASLAAWRFQLVATLMAGPGSSGAPVGVAPAVDQTIDP